MKSIGRLPRKIIFCPLRVKGRFAPHSLEGGGCVRVLLVEDTADLRRLYARSLRQHGCIVLDMADASAALEAVVEFSPDLVLTDVMMPAIDGIELIRRLRARPELAWMPTEGKPANNQSSADPGDGPPSDDEGQSAARGRGPLQRVVGRPRYAIQPMPEHSGHCTRGHGGGNQPEPRHG
jgi:response regulator receiver domain-containing protein